ncbi:MAG: virginiamycin lyase [Nocardioidaceae bacterium]|nr:virginiamycin lyase [Nocardioidaceae bacterium]
MSRRVGRVLIAVVAAGFALSAEAAVAAAPASKLQQFRVPTANSHPRAIATGSDGNRWFIEGTDLTGSPAKIGRVTVGGAVTELAPDQSVGCNQCILSDIAQGPANVLYVASNDPTLIRFNVATNSFLAPVQMPNSLALAGTLAIHGDDVWITDFNNDVVWRYRISTGQFTSVPASDPSDVAVDQAGNAWFAEPGDVNAPGTSNIGRIDAVTGAVTRTATTVSPRNVTVATDGQVWFTALQPTDAIGRLDPATGSVTLFPLGATGTVGPEAIAASPDGSVWFAQETKGNVARITNAGVITEGKVVKGSGPLGITVATDGDPWYTMTAANKVATLHLL